MKTEIKNLKPEAAIPHVISPDSTPARLLAPTPSTTPPTQESGPTSHRRNGKVARLPKELRELVNSMLEDGIPYDRICLKLADHGHHLNPDNLSRWHAGGFQDWLKEQSWMDELRARLDFASTIINHDHDGVVEAASLRVAILRMYRLLATFDPAELVPVIKDQPGAYTRILNALCKLTSGAIKLQTQQRIRQAVRSSPKTEAIRA